MKDNKAIEKKINDVNLGKYMSMHVASNFE